MICLHINCLPTSVSEQETPWFELPYRRTLEPGTSFIQMLVVSANRLIHNEVLRYDKAETIAKIVVRLSESSQKEYLEFIMQSLLKFFPRGSEF
jgi:hypothetical protein